jgi:hypothetical protein
VALNLQTESHRSFQKLVERPFRTSETVKALYRGSCWNLVHVAHLVNSKACTIIVPYCQDKERLPCLNMGVSYHSKIDACERKETVDTRTRSPRIFA